MSQQLERQMLDALELFHYAARFQEKIFLLYFERLEDFEEMLTDLRVLLSARVSLVLCFAPGVRLDPLREQAEWGFPFNRVQGAEMEGLSLALKQAQVPLMTLSGTNDLWPLAEKLKAKKILFIQASNPLAGKGEALSHAHLDVLLEKEPHLLPVAFQQQKRKKVELAFIAARSGNLYLEIFTHQGSGTLIAQSLDKEVRPAAKTDVMDISLLMKPYIQAQAILPLSLEQIAAEVERYFVAYVNHEMVATARLKPWGQTYELSKFCTLPRYRGRGMAKALCARLIEEAKKQGGGLIFALSIEAKMWRFFQSFGFVEVDKQDLPLEWRQGYDPNRPSKALALRF